MEGFPHQSCSNLQPSCLAREHLGQVSGSHVLHHLIALPLLMFLVIASFLLAFSLRRVDRLLRHLWLPASASAAALIRQMLCSEMLRVASITEHRTP
jgi:hypothetical protein